MGLTVICLGVFLVVLFVVQFPLFLGPLRFGGLSVSDLHVCRERAIRLSYILILAGSLPWLHGMAR